MMDDSFLKKVFENHKSKTELPPPAMVEAFLEELVGFLFPAYSHKSYSAQDEVNKDFKRLKERLLTLLLFVEDQTDLDTETVVDDFFKQLPILFEELLLDAKAIEEGDPAAVNQSEVIRSYPGFYAIAIYRIAHQLHKQKVPFLPRIFTESAHSKTGIDIHPGAQIKPYFFIDHGTGIVIGETTVIGSRVKLYQGVTLGALSITKEMANTKRHPTIEDGVVIYAGATILGGNTIIGVNSTIGGNVWLTQSVEAGSKIYNKSQFSPNEA